LTGKLASCDIIPPTVLKECHDFVARKEKERNKKETRREERKNSHM
jgi:hypothetical protein